MTRPEADALIAALRRADRAFRPGRSQPNCHGDSRTFRVSFVDPASGTRYSVMRLSQFRALARRHLVLALVQVPLGPEET